MHRIITGIIGIALLAAMSGTTVAQTPRPDAPSDQSAMPPLEALKAAEDELRKADDPRAQVVALLNMLAAARRYGPNDADPRDKDTAIAHINRQLGVVLRLVGDEEASDTHFAEAARLFEQLGMKVAWASLQVAIGKARADALGRLDKKVEESYGSALTVLTEKEHPELWAWVHTHLALGYLASTDGERVQNVELGLDHARTALRARSPTKDPFNWGVTQQAIAFAWLNRQLGQRDENVDRSIEAGEQAAAALSPDLHARRWAQVHATLSSAYLERAQRTGEADLDRSIASARNALTVLTREVALNDWIRIQLTLAKACRDRHLTSGDRYPKCAIDAANYVLGALSPESMPDTWADAQLTLAAALRLDDASRAENHARAKNAVDAVLRNLPRDAFPYLWARAANLLGAIHLDDGDGSSDTLRAAVAAFEQSLQVWTKSNYPGEWATTQRNIALALRKTGAVDQLDKAISALEQALTVITRADRPREWSVLMMELGDVYTTRGRTADIEKAVQVFKDALAAIDPASDPDQWGLIQGRLGEAYLARRLGVRQNNVLLARQALETAARTIRKDNDPSRWGQVQLSLGATYYYDRSDRANKAAALRALRQAATVITRQNDPIRWAKLNANLAAIYLEQPDGGVLEHLRAAVEAATNALQIFDARTMPAEWILTQRNLASAHHRSAMFSGGPSREAHLAEARKVYQAALALSPRETHPADRLRTLAGLIQVDADRADWLSVESVSEDGMATAEQLIAESVFEEELSSIVSRVSTAASLGALAAAHRGDATAAWNRLERVRARLLSSGLRTDERSLSETQKAELRLLRERLRSLDPYDAPESFDQRQSIRSEIARLRGLAQAEQSVRAPDATTPIVTMAVTTFGGAVLVRTGDRDLVGLIGTRSGPVLHAMMFGSLSQGKGAKWDWVGGEGADGVAGNIAAPLWPMLERAGVARGSRIVWIPPYQLSHVPLAAARHPTTNESLIDRYEIVQVPSLDAWLIASARMREQANAAPRIAGIFNPTGDLPHADAEKTLIAGTVPKLPIEIADRGIEPTALLDKFATSSIWHFATHGRFDWGDFRRSGVELGPAADTKPRRLTSEELLYGVDRIGPKLVLLTICESGLGDIKETPNESLGLPSAFLQAGAAGVVAAMWKVEDLSTALLVAKFYDAHLVESLPPPAALRAAQLWLRSATGDDLFDFVQALQARVESPAVSAAFEQIVAAVQALPRTERPYSDVKRWGAFVYVGG